MMLPKKVNVVEVGPRDGFQNLKEWIPTELKLEVIDLLVQADFKKIEFTSFVSPKAIPQMKDAAEIADVVTRKYKEVVWNALVPNLTGAIKAWEAGVREVTYVISASERHNMENVRRTVEESFAGLRELKEQLPGMRVKLDIATSFGCPFLGDIPAQQVLKMIGWALEIKVEEICLCDTIGVANPRQTGLLLGQVKKEYPGPEFGLHFHDTRGMGLANVLMALQQGFTVFESAVGGLGGCPFAPGAAGNIASEDLVNMLEQMGVDTGINLDILLAAAGLVKARIIPDLTGHMVNVCKKG